MAAHEVNLSRVQIARGHGGLAEQRLRRALAIRERLLDPTDWRLAQAKSLLGASLAAQGRYADAEPLMLEADRRLRVVPGPEGRERGANRARLVALYLKLGRRQQANAFR